MGATVQNRTASEYLGDGVELAGQGLAAAIRAIGTSQEARQRIELERAQNLLFSAASAIESAKRAAAELHRDGLMI